jgi:hypothetical protein
MNEIGRISTERNLLEQRRMINLTALGLDQHSILLELKIQL